MDVLEEILEIPRIIDLALHKCKDKNIDDTIEILLDFQDLRERILCSVLLRLRKCSLSEQEDTLIQACKKAVKDREKELKESILKAKIAQRN